MNEKQFGLKAFYYECSKCQNDIRMDYLDEEKICECGNPITISKEIKEYLRRTQKPATGGTHPFSDYIAKLARMEKRKNASSECDNL